MDDKSYGVKFYPPSIDAFHSVLLYILFWTRVRNECV